MEWIKLKKVFEYIKSVSILKYILITFYLIAIVSIVEETLKNYGISFGWQRFFVDNGLEWVWVFSFKLIMYSIGAGVLFVVISIPSSIISKKKEKKLKKKTDSLLNKISNSKQKRMFLENDKNLLFKYNIKENSHKKIKEITALPLNLKQWQVFVTYWYKHKAEEKIELICTIYDTEVEQRLESQKKKQLKQNDNKIKSSNKKVEVKKDIKKDSPTDINLLSDNLRELNKLKEDGILTEEEFNEQKKKLLKQ